MSRNRKRAALARSGYNTQRVGTLQRRKERNIKGNNCLATPDRLRQLKRMAFVDRKDQCNRNADNRQNGGKTCQQQFLARNVPEEDSNRQVKRGQVSY